ncbi:MAG: response regulator [Lachnospiraceae bacterium]|nr:response regulator [Lachnospiraceae bacterium]
MHSLLIVEDERMIRQGIKAMVQRSGVPVEVILECSNGEDALNLLSMRHVDVVFTDIRMQKMDGIELVRRIGEMEDKPLIVAISGYDDFSYAVEMLRNGVKEYLLKPVEREKIAEVLRKLDEELQQRSAEHSKELELGIRQFRDLVANPAVTEEARQLIISKYEPLFFQDEYRILIYKGEPLSDTYHGFLVGETSQGEVIVLQETYVKAFLKNELSEKCVGVGGVHKGLGEIREAFEEAAAMRRLAFVKGVTCTFGEDAWDPAPEALREKAKELLTESERTRRIQVVGTDKTEEVIRRWRLFFTALERFQIELPEFSAEMEQCILQLSEVYRENLSDEDRAFLESSKVLHLYENLGEYQTGFMDWLLDLNKRLGDRPDDIGIRQKIVQAQQYILEHYDSDLNMAVVSNLVSMNYSLFSYSFKQYTGQNFVNYLKEIRIAKARELLEQTDLKVIEISQMVGYENEKNFMKIFKALCGVTPGEYRKNMTV